MKTSETAENVFGEFKGMVKKVEHSKTNINSAAYELDDIKNGITQLLSTIDETSLKETELSKNMLQLQNEASNVKEILAI